MAASSRPPTVWRVRTKTEFARLREAGRTVRNGPLALRFAPADRSDQPPQVAYAIGRSVGSAVVRNRLKRRLRHIVAELAASHRIPQGISLIMVQPDAVELNAAELHALVDDLFSNVRGRGAHHHR